MGKKQTHFRKANFERWCRRKGCLEIWRPQGRVSGKLIFLSFHCCVQLIWLRLALDGFFFAQERMRKTSQIMSVSGVSVITDHLMH